MSNRRETAAVCACLLLALLWRVPADVDLFVGSLWVLCELATCVLLAVLMSTRVDLWAGAFVALCAISAVFPEWDAASRRGLHQVMFGAVWYSAVVLLRPDPRAVWYAIGAAAMVNSVFLLLQWAGVDPWALVSAGAWKIDLRSMPTGIVGGRNESGALMAMAFPVMVRWPWPLGLLWAAGLGLSMSTGPVVAVACGMVFISAMQPRYRAVAVAMSLAVAGYMLIDRNNISSAGARLYVWKLSAVALDQQPLTGVGLGHFSAATRADYAHSWLVHWLTELGPAFLPVCAGWLIDAARRFRREAILSAAGVVVVLTGAGVSYWFQHPVTGVLALTVMGLYRAETER